MTEKKIASFLLRTGLAVVFLYAAIASFLEPSSWLGFLPAWLRSILPAPILLAAFSIYEIILSLWLLSNWRNFEAAVFANITLFMIIISNLSLLDVVFRDVAILFSGVALAVLAKEK